MKQFHQKNLQTALKIANLNVNIVSAEKKHFSFLFYKSKLVGWAHNNYKKTHPLLNKLGYGPKRIHSEFAVLLPYIFNPRKLRNCTLINVRLNTLNELQQCKPCRACNNLILSLPIKSVLYYEDGWKTL